ncbi:hypothetical protein GCM10022419_083500 [Nonomuraea rosea]|uniref:Inorganic phosphate transporter n=1 Tax=Nonomuraea rosea TaxID=638574 RepID=A0ABP6YQ91_9ACTN
MDANTVLLAVVVATALAFDFTTGFHDTANAMATSIATGALRPKIAVAMLGTYLVCRLTRSVPERLRERGFRYGQIGSAWLITLPAAAAVGALAWAGVGGIGGALGVSVVFAVALLLSGGLYLAWRRQPVHAGNVNDEWAGRLTPVQP